MRRLLSPIPLAAVCALVALVALLGYGLASTQAERQAEQGSEHGERTEAPALELPKLFGGGEGALADYRGKVVLLNIWASWCDPCREESPLLQRWHERMRRRGGTVLGVDVHDASGDARAFVRKYRLTYPQLRDGPGDSIDQFGVGGYPWSFVIDRDGRIASTRRGPVDDRFMRREVAPLLEQGA